MTNPGKKLMTVNLDMNQYERVKRWAHQNNTNMSQYIRDLIQRDQFDLPKLEANGWPNNPGFIDMGSGHRVRYEDLHNVAVMLNAMEDKECKCQYCGQGMEMVDMKRRYDQFDDEQAEIYETMEVYFECGNGQCNTGTRTMLELTGD